MSAYSRVTYTGTGSVFNASFSFPYLNSSDIYVFVDGVSVPFTFLNTSTVTPAAVPAAGATIQVRRATQKTTSPVNFTDGSVLLERDLDLLSTYSLYLAQEADDAVTSSITLNTSNLFDAQSSRIINLANPVAATDAVNRQYFEGVYTPLLDAKVTAAAASAAAALVSQGAASSSQTASASSQVAAADSQTSATSSASTATTKAAEALASQVASLASQTAAVSSASASSTSATAAATSTSAALVSQNAAAASATTATGAQAAVAASATTATTQAGIATTKATEASTSAVAAAASQASATASQSSATTSAATATTQASTATTKAAEAVTSAAAALVSQGAAASSQTASAGSATTATAQAVIATDKAAAALASANAAGSAQSAAEVARDQTLSAYDSFDDRYLGTKAAAPTLDNDGSALVGGSLYFNTVTNEMQVWTGTSWLAAYASLSGAMLATANLSDLGNLATAKANLAIGNVENKSSATIRGELTAADVTTALGVTPVSTATSVAYSGLTGTVPTWNQSTAGNAATATKLQSTNWSVEEVSAVLYFKYGGVNKFKIDSSGNLTVVGNVTAYGTVE